MTAKLLIAITILSILWVRGTHGADFSVCFPDASEEDRMLFDGCLCNDGQCEHGGNRDLAINEVDCPPEVARRMSEFPRASGTYNETTCLIIRGGQFKTLEMADLAPFPNLLQLEVIDGDLDDISNRAFNATPNLHFIELPGNDLTIIPPVRRLENLTRLVLTNNRIQSLSNDDLSGLTGLSYIDLTNNDIKTLENEVFKGLGSLRTVSLAHNSNLKGLDSDTFVIDATTGCNDIVGCGISELDLSFTSIAALPCNGLRKTLLNLFLNGTRNLKRFDGISCMTDDENYRNRTFPRLENVQFHYSALCCQYRDLPYVDFFDENQVAPCSQPSPPPALNNVTVCYNSPSSCPLEVVSNDANTTIVPIENLCASISKDCCPVSVCGRMSDACGSNNALSSSGVVCVEVVPFGCDDDTFTINQMDDENCTGNNCSTTELTCKHCPSLTPCPPLVNDSSLDDYCPWKTCSLGLTDERHLDACNLCQIQRGPGCCDDNSCAYLWETCADDCPPLKKRSTHYYDPMPTRALRSVDPPPEGWFYYNASVLCYDSLSASPTQTPAPAPGSTPAACDPFLTALDSAPESVNSTVCHPMNDPFNPCEDLLGSSHALRILIWPVIILALLGNVIVIFVIVGYVIIVRRTKVDSFIIHFLYLNLAVADLMMGIYLFTIAVVDLDTLGNFSLEDVEWRTGPGCGFAGFMAITSTMASVYMLLVITLERVYTFMNVMHYRKVSRITVYVTAAFGWLFAALMGFLPLVGVNDYSAVAICLPFDVSTIQAKVYITFLLVVTGLAFLAIAVSYGVIFYEVFHSRSKRRLQPSIGEAWKTEIKVGLRMSLLVVTNLVCWFPIAILALTAVYGRPLLSVSASKFIMVFVFPINACLNPILYSLATKAFRHNFCFLLSKGGMFREYNLRLQSQRIGYYTPSNTSTQQSNNGAQGRRGTIVTRLLSFANLSSDGEAMKDAPSHQASVGDGHELLSQRMSVVSNTSGEDPTSYRWESRRSSNFSETSNEEPQHVSFVSTSCRASSPGSPKDDKEEFASKLKPAKLGALSMGMALPDLPEETEVDTVTAPTPTPSEESAPQQTETEEDREEGYFTDVRRDSEKGTTEWQNSGGVYSGEFPQHHVDTDTPQDDGGGTPSSEEGIEIPDLKTVTLEVIV